MKALLFTETNLVITSPMFDVILIPSPTFVVLLSDSIIQNFSDICGKLIAEFATVLGDIPSLFDVHDIITIATSNTLEVCRCVRGMY